MQFLITATFAVISFVGMASPCPLKCYCGGNTTYCYNRGFYEIPKNIPKNTYKL